MPLYQHLCEHRGPALSELATHVPIGSGYCETIDIIRVSLENRNVKHCTGDKFRCHSTVGGFVEVSVKYLRLG